MAEVEVGDAKPFGTEEKGKSAESREIKGNLPYTTSFGVLKAALDGIVTAERPDKFSADFMATVLKISGGSARAVPPILKRMGFLNSDGSPADLYSRFKSDSGRSSAALEGLRKAFPEIFRRNEFAHRADPDKVRDIIVEITGLNKNDQVVRAISGTFQTIRAFVDINKLSDEDLERPPKSEPSEQAALLMRAPGNRDISLTYQIHVVLPETTNIQVFNAIFKSLKENLLD